MTRLYLTFFFMLSLCSVHAAAQIKSVYTSLDEKNCQKLKPHPDVLYEGLCPGPAGFRLKVFKGQDRQGLEVLVPSGRAFDLSLKGASRNFLGETAEWRIRNGMPIGLIIRYRWMSPVDGELSSMHMVSKISRSVACITDLVDRGTGENRRARQLADSSRSRPCRTE